VIELSREFGAIPKVWIHTVYERYFTALDKYSRLHWSVSPKAQVGDLVLMYRCSPEKCIKDILYLSGKRKERNRASWREGFAWFGQIQRVCRLSNPVFLEDLRQHRVLKTAPFVRFNMQGAQRMVSSYWPYIFDLIVSRNPQARKWLRDWLPEKL
jgi:hypothetical protein